jgi:hypothetical protein
VADHSAGTLLKELVRAEGFGTHTADGLNVVPPVDWATRALVLGAGFEPALDGFSNRFLCLVGIPELVRLPGFEPGLNTI